MNDNYSMTAQAERLSDSKTLEAQWKSIDWEKAETYVNRLQVRIAKATKEMEHSEKASVFINTFILWESTGSA